LENKGRGEKKQRKYQERTLFVMVHKPITRVSLALEGLEFVEVKFCEREQKVSNHYLNM
jgi:hypothetical protein